LFDDAKQTHEKPLPLVSSSRLSSNNPHGGTIRGVPVLQSVVNRTGQPIVPIDSTDTAGMTHLSISLPEDKTQMS